MRGKPYHAKITPWSARGLVAATVLTVFASLFSSRVASPQSTADVQQDVYRRVGRTIVSMAELAERLRELGLRSEADAVIKDFDLLRLLVEDGRARVVLSISRLKAKSKELIDAGEIGVAQYVLERIQSLSEKSDELARILEEARAIRSIAGSGGDAAPSGDALEPHLFAWTHSLVSVAARLHELADEAAAAGEEEEEGHARKCHDTILAILIRARAMLDAEVARLGELVKKDLGKGSLDKARARLRVVKGFKEEEESLAASIASLTGGAAKPSPTPDPTAKSGWFSARFRYRTVALRNKVPALAAVNRALDWLAKHQGPDGFWDGDGFTGRCRLNQCDGLGKPVNDLGITGLAVLAYLHVGETPRSGVYRRALQSALRHLRSIQDSEGCFGPRTISKFTYGHAIATRAMVEAYALTESPWYKYSAQQGIDFIHKAQNPYLAWRYSVRPGDNDTSVTGWMIMALHAAKAAGLRVDQAGFDGTKAWLEKVTEPEYGRAGYTARGTGPGRPPDLMARFPPDRSESLTAVGILSRILIGENPRKSEMIQKGVKLCLKAQPVWNEQYGIDMYYWYFGTQALFQVGGKAWKQWNVSVDEAVINDQRRDGDEQGSWDPVGPWGREGGRVYSTALCAMMLATPHTHRRIGE